MFCFVFFRLDCRWTSDITENFNSQLEIKSIDIVWFDVDISGKENEGRFKAFWLRLLIYFLIYTLKRLNINFPLKQLSENCIFNLN